MPLKCKTGPILLPLSRPDLVRVDLVSVLVQYVLDDRAVVVERQVEAQEVNVSA